MENFSRADVDFGSDRKLYKYNYHSLVMTQEINMLYNGNKTKLIRQDYHLGWINRDAEEMARSEGSAVVIRVREGLPNLESVTINILKYEKDKANKLGITEKSETIVLPRTTVDAIAEVYKK